MIHKIWFLFDLIKFRKVSGVQLSERLKSFWAISESSLSEIFLSQLRTLPWNLSYITALYRNEEFKGVSCIGPRWFLEKINNKNWLNTCIMSQRDSLGIARGYFNFKKIEISTVGISRNVHHIYSEKTSLSLLYSL